jgi:hypothetical protein
MKRILGIAMVLGLGGCVNSDGTGSEALEGRGC